MRQLLGFLAAFFAVDQVWGQVATCDTYTFGCAEGDGIDCDYCTGIEYVAIVGQNVAVDYDFSADTCLYCYNLDCDFCNVVTVTIVYNCAGSPYTTVVAYLCCDIGIPDPECD